MVTAAVSLVALLGLGALAWTFLGGDETTTPEPTRRMDTVAPPSVMPSTPTLESSSPRSEATTMAPVPAEVTPSEMPPPAETQAVTTEASDTPTTAVTPGNTEDVQEAARTQLEELHAESMSSISIDGRWVAVLSSKKSGTTDQSQTAKNGSHTFYDDDILALHEELAARYAPQGDVFLVKSSDFGRQPTSGDVYWRTIVDQGFYDEEQAANWCNYQFTGTVEEIQNSCLPRELVPPTQS